MNNVEKALNLILQHLASLSVSHKALMHFEKGLNWYIWEAGKFPDMPECDYLKSDGESVWINPDFFVSLTPLQQLDLIVHELHHRKVFVLSN